MAFTDTISDYFLTADFAVVGTYVVGSETISANGIFENLYSEDLNVNGSVPTFTCAESSVTSLAVDAQLTVESSAYYIRTKKPDGDGLTTLIMEKVL